METSFNLYVLQSNSYELLTVDIYKNEDKERYFKFDDKTEIFLKSLRLKHLRDYVHKEVDVPDIRKLKLWKLNGFKYKKIKEQSISTEEDIVQKLYGEEMKLDELFNTHFRAELDKLDGDEPVSSIITIIPATVKTVEDIIKFALEGSTPLTSQTHTPGSDTNTSDTDTPQFNWRDMPLKDRDLSTIAVIVRDNVINNSKVLKSSYTYAKSEFNILVCGGAPGIGKTRFGSELFNNIKTNRENIFENINDPELRFEHFEYLYLDFGNSIRLDKNDYKLDNEVIICLRVLYEYFVKGKYYLSFDAFREKVLPFIRFLKIQEVFASIQQSLSLKSTQRLFIFLHIDEFQLIFKWDEDREDKLFKYIINVLAPEHMYGNGSNLIFVQEFLSGTARQAAIREKEASKVSLESIKCSMLSVKSMIQIVDFYAEEYGAGKINDEYRWKLCNQFLQIIQDTGGLPRALQYMLKICFQKLNSGGEEFFRTIFDQNFNNIFRLTADKLESLYGIYNIVRENKRLALELLYCCMVEKPVTPEECLDPKDNIHTIENLETDTHIILKESIHRGYFYIEMPFFFVVLYNDILRIIPIELEETFNVNYMMHWQGWELFVAYYEAFINNMLIVRENKSEVTLRELYHGAHGKDETLNKTVKLKQLNVRQSLVQFPCLNLSDKYNKPIKWEEGNDIIINGKGAPFGDLFVARKILYDSKISNALMIVQDKWDYNGKELTELEVIEECIKNLKSLVKKSESIINSYPDPCCITIFVTTRKCNFDYGQLPEDVLVIDQTNFKEFFGPIFSSRAAFYLAKDIN